MFICCFFWLIYIWELLLIVILNTVGANTVPSLHNVRAVYYFFAFVGQLHIWPGILILDNISMKSSGLVSAVVNPVFLCTVNINSTVFRFWLHLTRVSFFGIHRLFINSHCSKAGVLNLNKSSTVVPYFGHLLTM